MTSRDFRAIAAIIADGHAHNATDANYAEGWHASLTATALRFADLLAQTNPRFDRARFLAAATGAPLTAGDKPRARDFAR